MRPENYRKLDSSLEVQIDRIFSLQRDKLPKLKKRPVEERVAKLKTLKSAILSERESIKRAIQEDFHKAPTETELTEIFPVISELNLCIKNLSTWAKDEKVKTPLLLLGSRSYVRYEPKGNVLIIGPWNYPFNLCMIPMIDAVAAGNAVILKPSEFTPNTNQVIKKIIDRVFSEDEVFLFEGEASVAEFLLTKPFHHIFFTGSTAVGKKIMAAASKNLSDVTLELGGKSPVILDENLSDKELEEAVQKIMWGKFINSGQTCIAPDYVLLTKAQVTPFVEKARKVLQGFYGKDNSTPATKIAMPSSDYAHIISKRHHDRLSDLLSEAVSKGAVVEIGSTVPHSAEALYFPPTLISKVDIEARIMQEEIFGPILPLVTYEKFDQVINIIKMKERPLAIYLFTGSSETEEKILSETTAGAVCINEVVLHIANHHLPFGGVNHSGIGHYHGIAGFREFSHHKPVLKRYMDIGAQYLYPPYNKSKRKLVDTLFKKLHSMF